VDMRGLIGQNHLRRFRLFEPIFSYNFALGLEFRCQYFSVSVSVSIGIRFHPSATNLQCVAVHSAVACFEENIQKLHSRRY
jgi:hypothetical protein